MFAEKVGAVRNHVDVLHPQSGEAVVSCENAAALTEGNGALQKTISLEKPLLWTLWDRGMQHLYTLRIRLLDESRNDAQKGIRFGVIGVFLEQTKDAAIAVWAANDTPTEFAGCTAKWCVTNGDGEQIACGGKTCRFLRTAFFALKDKEQVNAAKAMRRFQAATETADASAKTI